MCYIQKSFCLNLAIAGFNIRIHGLGKVEKERGKEILGHFLSTLNPDFALGFEENGLNLCQDKACEQKNRRRIRCNTPRTLLRAKRSHGKDLETFYQNPNANSGLNAKAMEIEVVRNKPIADIPSRYHVFSSGSHWQLYRKDTAYYYAITSQEKRRDFISRLAVFSSDFRSGRIYAYSPVGDRDFPLSYPLDQLLLIHLASLHRSVFVHGCAVVSGGSGLLFAGSSGAGKSTLGGLFKKHRDAIILSDDRIIVKREGSRYVLYGTPWHGTLPFSSNEKAPLSKVFFLQKAKKNRLIPLSRTEALRRLVSLSFLPYWDQPGMNKALANLWDVSRRAVFYELSFRPDKSAVEIIENVL